MKGKAKCILCMKVITYCGRGFPSLSDHMKTESHVHNVVIKLKNYCLPGTSKSVHEHDVVCTVPLQCIWIKQQDHDHQKALHSQLCIFLIANQMWRRCWYPFLWRKTCHLHWLVSKLHYLTVLVCFQGC